MNGLDNGDHDSKVKIDISLPDPIFPLDDLTPSDYAEDPSYAALAQCGLNGLVIAEFCEMIRAGIIQHEELDERLLEFAKSQSADHVRFVLNQFRKSNLTGVQNSVQYLGSLLKNFKERVKLLGTENALNTPVFYGPKKDSLQALLDRTGYSVEVTIGQRKYGGPPPGYDGPNPGSGCEVYIGRIPKNVYEDELVPVLEKFGQLYDFRLMMDPVNGTNKGYAFATFMNKEDATRSAKQLEDYEVKPGKKLRCNVSIANTRLFIGNIPKSKSKEEILHELSTVAEIEGVKDVIIYADVEDPANKRNCGYCFVEFADHKAASTAKRRLVDGHVKPWNSNVVANWAEPQEEPDSDVMSQVRTLFVKNLREVADEETVRKAFSMFGEVYKIRRIKDYAFVYYNERDHAVQAIEKMNGKEFHGAILDVSLAKPQSDARKKAVQARMMTKMYSGVGGGADMSMGNPMAAGYYGGYYGGYGDYSAAGYGGAPYDGSGYGGAYDMSGGYAAAYGDPYGAVQYPMPGMASQRGGPGPMRGGYQASPRVTPYGGGRGAGMSPAMGGAAPYRGSMRGGAMGGRGMAGSMGYPVRGAMAMGGAVGAMGMTGSVPMKRPYEDASSYGAAVTPKRGGYW